MVILCSLILVAVIAAFISRYKLVLRRAKRLEAVMPPINQLSWGVSARNLQIAESNSLTPFRHKGFDLGLTLEPPEVDTASVLFRDPVVAAAVADGFLAGVPVLHAVLQIDPSVLAAIQNSTAEHIASFPAAHAYIEQHFFAGPALSAEGWYERLTGYVTEQKAASALEAAGHHVTFAATANQPVWDLLVDGHPVQIKEGLSGVKQFLAEHHNVDIYTGDSVAAAIHDPHVHGLSDLGSDHIHALTQHSLEGVHDTFIPGFHFPYITLAFSTWREVKLLNQGDTTIHRALKNVGMDVAGVGTGATAGVQLGTLLGSAAGPPGAAVGALLGGIVGGISGKLVSTGFRHAPFKQAREHYEATVAEAEKGLDLRRWTTAGEVGALRKRLKAQYEIRKIAALHSSNLQIAEEQRNYSSRFSSFYSQFAMYLGEMDQNLNDQETSVLKQLPESGIVGWLIASEQHGTRRAIKLWFKRARATIKIEMEIFAALKQKDNFALLKEEARRFLEAYTFVLPSLDADFSKLSVEFARVKVSAAAIEATLLKQLADERDAALREATREMERLRNALVDAVEAWNKKITLALDNLRLEAKAIGHAL